MIFAQITFKCILITGGAAIKNNGKDGNILCVYAMSVYINMH